MSPKIRKPLSADLFGSLCYTFQHGKFRKLYGDLTRVDARLDICSASAFAKGAANIVSNVFGSSSANKEVNPLASPRLNVILQQQVFFVYTVVAFRYILHRSFDKIISLS